MAEHIDRETIEYPYKTMSMWGLNSNTCKAYNEGVKAVEDYIANLPAANVVEVVHGEWIKDTTFDLCGIDYYKCSVCGKEQQIEYPYCPNCGARMDGDNK